MIIRNLFKALITTALLLAVSGCGSANSNTNGTLTLTVTPAANNGFVGVKSIASVVPVMVGADISFTAKMSGYDPSAGSIRTTETHDAIKATDKAGNAEWTANFTNPTFGTTLEVTAIISGLSKTVQVAIPAYVVTP
ncbi:MAG: hypothetical protein HXX17_10905 [Geobacteraceae bacterium]|nr:hypothetical protein [Geobacteraceae bacterium]